MVKCLDQVKKDFLREELKEAIRKKKKKLGPEYNEYTAGVVIRELTEERLKQIRQIKREKALQFLRERDILTNYMNRFENDPGRGARLAWAYDPNGANYESNVFSRAASLIAENNALMPSLAALRPRIWSWSSGMKRHLNDNILKELRNQNTGDELAARIAKDVRKAIDHGWRKYRIAGGRGGTIKNYLPQQWLDLSVARAGRDQWKADVLDALDRERMVDLDDGHILDDDEVNELLDYAYDSITTRGANQWADPGVPPNVARSISKRRDQARVLHFTDEGDIALREKYMNPDILSTVQMYRDRLMQDTATIQILGPNPDKTLKTVTNSIRHRLFKQGEKTGKGISRHLKEKTIRDIEQIHQHVMRRRETIGDEGHRIVDNLDQTARFGSTALLLGGALVPSISDFATQGLNNMVRGTSMLNRIGEYFSFMMNSEKRVEAAISDMLVHDTILNADAAAARFLGHGLDRAQGHFGRAAEFVLEKSGLTIHTDAGRMAGLRTHQLALGADVKVGWNDLAPLRRAQYESYGFTKSDWDRFNGFDLGKVKYYKSESGYFDFNKARSVLSEQDFRRLHEMVMHEGQNSTLTTDIRAEKVLETFTLGEGAAPGSLRAVASNQLRMFKRFPVMAALMLRETAMNPHIPGWTKAKAIPIWFFSAMTLGMMALQTRQILQGRNPLPFFDDDQPQGINWGFVYAGILYGGGLPFIGDVVPELMGINTDTLNAKGYHGKSFLDLMPTVGLGRRILRPFGEAWGQIAEGEYEAATRTLGGEGLAELGRTAGGLLGTNIWYVRAPLDHLIFQQWENIFDPEGFADKSARQQDYLEGQGTSAFWLPGELIPSEAPDFGQ